MDFSSKDIRALEFKLLYQPSFFVFPFDEQTFRV